MKKYWGLFPFLIFLIASAFAAGLCLIFKFSVSYFLFGFFICFGLLSFTVLLLWVNIKIVRNYLTGLRIATAVLSVIIFLFSSTFCLFGIIEYQPDRHYTQKIKSDHRASEKAFESESNTEVSAKYKKLDIKSAKNTHDELEFLISVDDYIQNYNYFYFAAHKTLYFDSSSDWLITKDKSLYSEYSSTRYRFTEDEKIRPMPKVSVFTDPKNKQIFEIRIVFDDHGYREEKLNKFTEICKTSLKVFLTDLSDEKIDKLFDNLYKSGMDNYYGTEYTRPPKDIFCKNDVGIYAYYGAGTLNICIIPVNDDVISYMSSKGATIHNID